MHIKQTQALSQHYRDDGVMSLDEHALYLSQQSKISAKKYNKPSNHNKSPLIQNKGPSLQN